MQFQIISHASVQISHNGVSLLTDPWLVGSCYWRSWWIYPPLNNQLLESLNPDFIYLTHIHWDHFHGPSLRKLGKDKTIIIPKAPGTRLSDDLMDMGYKNIIELHHGQCLELGKDLKITSYHFFPFLDSALVVEADGVTLLNANDTKLMGAPLKQILRKHPHIDFLFRSHSSANGRACYEFPDQPEDRIDSKSRYAEEFIRFAKTVKPRYAIPFASNHCHLHKDVYSLNPYITTPAQLKEHYEEAQLQNPKLVVMLPGDNWSKHSGFTIQENTYFSERDKHLEDYLAKNQQKLEDYYKIENNAQVSLSQVKNYFVPFLKALPWPIRIYFKNYPITFIFKSGEKSFIYVINIFKKSIIEVFDVNNTDNPIQIHTSAFVGRQCLGKKLFSHLSISKRVKYRQTRANAKYTLAFNLLLDIYEHELLPLRNFLTTRFISCLFRRWREFFILYPNLLVRIAFRKRGQAFYEICIPLIEQQIQ